MSRPAAASASVTLMDNDIIERAARTLAETAGSPVRVIPAMSSLRSVGDFALLVSSGAVARLPPRKSVSTAISDRSRPWIATR